MKRKKREVNYGIIVAIIALIISFMAYNRDVSHESANLQIHLFKDSFDISRDEKIFFSLTNEGENTAIIKPNSCGLQIREYENCNIELYPVAICDGLSLSDPNSKPLTITKGSKVECQASIEIESVKCSRSEFDMRMIFLYEDGKTNNLQEVSKTFHIKVK